jgi:hypothetical protein
MPKSGVLEIETRNSGLEDDLLRIHNAEASDRFIRLRVTDAGSGMNRQVADRVFETVLYDKGVRMERRVGSGSRVWDCEAEWRVYPGIEPTGDGNFGQDISAICAKLCSAQENLAACDGKGWLSIGAGPRG